MNEHSLSTSRLVLEPLRESHADGIYESFVDERIWTYFPKLRPNEFLLLLKNGYAELVHRLTPEAERRSHFAWPSGRGLIYAVTLTTVGIAALSGS